MTERIFKVVIGFLLSVSASSKGLSQVPPRVSLPTTAGPANPFTQKTDVAVVATVDANGRPYVKVREEVTGSPFFLDGFRKATVTLSNGTQYKNIDLLLDEEKHEVHVVYQGHEIIVADGSVKEFSIVDTIEGKGNFYLFRSGYPAYEKNSIHSFYQVMTNGKLILLRFGKKQLVSSKDPISGQESGEYKSYETYYIYKDGKILEFKKDKALLTELMVDQQDKISKFIKEEKTNFKKISSVVELINYYNSL